MPEKKQYTMLDTDLSLAVDNVIRLIDQKDDWQEKFDEAAAKLKSEMDKAKKPEIIHIKGYEFKLDYKMRDRRKGRRWEKQLKELRKSSVTSLALKSQRP